MSVLLYLFFTIVIVEKADSQEYVEGNMVRMFILARRGHLLQGPSSSKRWLGHKEFPAVQGFPEAQSALIEEKQH